MSHIFLLLFLISDPNLKLDLLSIDILSIQGGLSAGGELSDANEPNSGFAFGFSGGRFRWFLQGNNPKSALAVGIETFNINVINSGWSGTGEFLSPQIGFAILGKKRKHYLVKKLALVPRVEFTSGISFFWLLNGAFDMFTIKNELAARFIPAVSLRLEHRYAFPSAVSEWGLGLHSVAAMLYLNLALDRTINERTN